MLLVNEQYLFLIHYLLSVAREPRMGRSDGDAVKFFLCWC